MRHVDRLPLPARTSAYLAGRQLAVDKGGDAKPLWDGARQTRAFSPVTATLRKMAGATQRCVFCEDSLGADVDHFWPVRGEPGYPERTFEWENLLVVCTPCNRAKGTDFPLAGDGQPLLIDPTADEPTEHLGFVPETGELAAVWEPGGEESKRGVETLRVIHNVISEPVNDRRRAAYEVLEDAVQEYLDGDRNSTSLINTIRKHRDFGLAHWAFLGRGASRRPFADLQTSAPAVWLEAQEAARATT